MGLLAAALLVAMWPIAGTATARLQAAVPGVIASPPVRKESPLQRIPLPVLAVALGLAVQLLLGGLQGVVLGVGVAVVVVRVIPRLESAVSRRRRAQLSSQVPDVVDLLAACLAAGAPVEAAVAAVAGAVDEPAAEVLRQVAAQLRLGASPPVAWESAAVEPAFAAVAAAVARSLDSGAPLADALPVVADELRSRRRAELEIATHKVGVRLTAPLGLLFLPAFVLLGVVPVVAALLIGLLPG
jgi:pilus assembly protein TadC